MKIVTIVGARPQFVKAAALSREFKNYSNLVCTAGANQISIYDCTHNGNYFDLVSSYFNYPNNLNINKRRQINGKFELTKEEIIQMSFNDSSWINRSDDNDMFVAGACENGNVYIISLIWSQCSLVWSGMIFLEYTLFDFKLNIAHLIFIFDICSKFKTNPKGNYI